MAEQPSLPDFARDILLQAFRTHHQRYEAAVHDLVQNPTDAVVIERLGDDLATFADMAATHSNIFEPGEHDTLQRNLAAMIQDLRALYRDAVDASHQGFPELVQRVPTGGRGRPRVVIDPHFLRWAYAQRSTAGICRFLGVSRSVVRNALLAAGIVERQDAPFPLNEPAFLSDNATQPAEDLDELTDPFAVNDDEDPEDIIDPDLPIPELHDLPPDIREGARTSYTAPVSTMSDDELDAIILALRSHYRRAGLRMLGGMLRVLGHRVPQERVRQSLLRVDPVRRIFERIRIRRRDYRVLGPNSLWHHDGQHGLIRWGIVIHGFIDGYSRLITGLRASNNNRAQTVLELFLDAARTYGVPSRLRGDHGGENLHVAAWMEVYRGIGRGSYIWGRSIHNVRIERLWVDVTAQVGDSWHQIFQILELRHGLDINNANHVWLLQFLFLPTINAQLAFFARTWNQHRIQIRRGPNRSPTDMFVFDMYVNGVRGDRLPLEEEGMDEEELEAYGIDWQEFRDERVLRSQSENNAFSEGASSWIGRQGPPDDLSHVVVEPPPNTLTDDEVAGLSERFQHLIGLPGDNAVIALWSQALAYVRVLCPDLF
ncbi:hypothetical protein MKEN_00403600 [Mycena kentingensis (nom. inval.)]|nr:hypothetical protein MKEN_00403600 [Mycena kentingensis (nom. inval.)]